MAEQAESIGTRLKKLREDRGISDQKLVNDLHGKGYSISRDSINKWENEKRTPNAEAIIALANYYDVPADYILGRSSSRLYDDRIQTTAITLGFSEKATQNLMRLSFVDGGMASDVLSDILESKRLIDVMKSLKKSKDGISRQIHYCDGDERPPERFLEQCSDISDMYIIKALRDVEILLRDVLGYNDLSKITGVK